MIKTHSALTIKEAAGLLNVHVETLRRQARKGAIPSFKIGKDWRFNGQELTDWARSQQKQRRVANVLIVDDEAFIGKLVTQILEPEGYRVLAAAGGREGLDMLVQVAFDLVLLDLKMDGMSGPEFLGEMRVVAPDLPVVVITGYPDSELMAQALAYGPLMLVAKPIHQDVLLKAVRTVLPSPLEGRNGKVKSADSGHTGLATNV